MLTGIMNGLCFLIPLIGLGLGILMLYKGKKNEAGNLMRFGRRVLLTALILGILSGALLFGLQFSSAKANLLKQILLVSAQYITAMVLIFTSGKMLKEKDEK